MLKPGMLVGIKYQIEHLIAEGGMAEVYLARCLEKPSAHAYVAIKRLKPSLARIPALVKLFVQEARLIIDIRHVHIVRGIELIEEGPELLLVMEYILGHEAGRLGLVLKNQDQKIRTEAALAIGIGIAKALSCIHSWPDDQGKSLALVHGDISPQNIIISTQGEVKLVDFGVATSAVHISDNQKEFLQGNIRYMSPEQLAGHALSEASDIYSLAMVLSEIVLDERQDSALMAVINKAKFSNLDQRYQKVAEFLYDLEALSKSMVSFDERLALRRAGENQSQDYKPRRNQSLKPALAVIFTLALVVSLVVVGGIRYFCPKLPETALDDRHCANYAEDLGQELRPDRLTLCNEENP